MKSKLLFLALISLQCTAPLTWAGASANFTGGVGTSAFDQFSGIAGGGWDAGWTEVRNSNLQSFTSSVVNTLPLNTGGNYLSYSFQSNANGQQGVQSVNRGYTNAVPLNQKHTISFDFRYDGSLTDFTTSSDRYRFFDAGTSSTIVDLAGFEARWIIGVQGNYSPSAAVAGPEFYFYNGTADGSPFSTSRFSASGLGLSSGLTYTFTINVDPSNKQWNASIFDGTATVNSGIMGFFANSTAAGGFLNAVGVVSGTDASGASLGESSAFSLDTISVIPEPNTFSLLILSMAFLWHTALRSKNKKLT
jgi:hypothetical protein